MNRKPKTIAFWEGRLPHWEVEDGRYFVTIHLAGSIPAAGRSRLRKIAAELRQAPKDGQRERLRLQRKIFREMERWLDRCRWNPHLRQPEVAQMVVAAIEHRAERGDWRVFEYVVMPTHLHLFCEAGSSGLKPVLEDFKRWTGHQAAKLLNRNGRSFWQAEWFDHWSRSDAEDEKIIAYIRNNPVRAGLVSDPSDWPYSGRSRLPDGTSDASK
jgi:REP element-mobilizing transposase RayT